MAIRYKVVHVVGEDRFSALAEGRFCIRYSNGRVVKAVENTIGIMCFKTRNDAEDWMDWVYDFTGTWGHYEIIRVKPKGRGFVPKYFSGRYGEDNLMYLQECIEKYGIAKGCRRYILEYGMSHSPPDGSICYQEIEVLD